MPLKTVEIIAPPGMKIDTIVDSIKNTIKKLESRNNTKYPYDLKISHEMSRASRYSGGAVPPLIIINGKLEFAGRRPDPRGLETKLLNIIRS
jgi:hypothetical protein